MSGGFEDDVIGVIRRLQPGDIVTYGEVAAEAGYPGAARAVGSLLRKADVDLPWWRVVGAGGYLKSPNPQRQALLLAEEGVLVVSNRVRPRAPSSPRNENEVPRWKGTKQ